MAELLHYSKGGIQGPMATAKPAQHALANPRQPAFTPPWIPSSPEPQALFAVDAGVQHNQAGAYVGASMAAAAALGDDFIGRERRRTPSGPAAPYQKAAAQRAAERAIRPWDPISGAGERAGAALLQVAGSNAGKAAFAAADAPALFIPPAPAVAAVVASAAGRVGRSGQDQDAAEGAVSVWPGAPARELWAVELFQKPPRYCTACRGGHEASKVGNPEWQPYSPAVRLGNLQMLDTKFRRAMRKGLLCFKLSESLWQPVQWSVQPTVMPVEQFRQQLALAFDGVREGHEPFRFLASRAVEDLLAAAMTRGSQVAAAVPELVAPLKLCLNTMQPQLVGGLLLLLIRLLRCHPAVPVALAPYCRHLLPGLAVFRSHRRLLELPAPVCLPPTGSFSGSGAPHGSVSRSCRICGVPVYREYEKAAGWELEVPKPLVWGTPEAAAIAQAGLGNKPAAAPAAAVEPSAAAAKRLPGRMCRRYTLESLIEEVLGLMAASGGETASRVIRNYVPGFTYYPPQDQPPCRTVEELLESSKTEKPRRPASSRPQRPRSAPRISGRRPVGASEGGPGGAAGGRNRRPATAGERVKKTAAAGGSWKAGQQHSGGDDGTDRPVPSAADLARWDGIEFRDVPYGLAVEEEQHALDPVEVAGGGSGGRGPGLRPAALHISTPVPVFDSPHDPLYGLLMSSAGFLNGRLVAEGHGTRTASVRPRRGGSGGGAMRASVNTEVPYRSSWAGLRQAI